MALQELNGDLCLSVGDRLRYLGGNLWRNLRPRRRTLPIERWRTAPAAGGSGSPLRILSEAFIREELPCQRPPGAVAVLDIGCGSGRLAALLAEAGYRGRYTGVDTDDRFAADTFAAPTFLMAFVRGDAHEVTLDGPYDLILSVSALEHVADDQRLIARLNLALSPDGVQVHIVPAPAALLLYLWHGFRQYSRAALAERFGRGAYAFALGGVASWLVHFLWVTVPEMLLHFRARRALPRTYAAMVRLALRLDAHLPDCPYGYAVLSARRGVETGST